MIISYTLLNLQTFKTLYYEAFLKILKSINMSSKTELSGIFSYSSNGKRY